MHSLVLGLGNNNPSVTVSLIWTLQTSPTTGLRFEDSFYMKI